MITRRSPEEAAKCALRDFRREDEIPLLTLAISADLSESMGSGRKGRMLLVVDVVVNSCSPFFDQNV